MAAADVGQNAKHLLKPIKLSISMGEGTKPALSARKGEEVHMSSDQDTNRAVWQDAGEMEFSANTGTQSTGDDQLAAETIDTDDLDTPDTESDLLHWTRQPLISKETLGTVARQFSPLLIPLPFALLVFLFTLPATLQGPPGHPSTLVMGMLLLALTILQGTLLYFAGSNDTLWLLSIMCGYALFIVAGVFAVFGITTALVSLGILVVLGAVLMQRGIRPTKEGHVDIVESFGKYAHTLYPGLNLLMPWEKVSRRLNIQETTWTCEEQKVSISREQFVRLTATISYQLLPEDAHLAALLVKNWEGSLRALFVGTLQSMVNGLTPNDFVSWSQSIYMRSSSETDTFNPAAATRWDRINNSLNRRIQDQAAIWGIQVNWVRIQDPVILPHTLGEQTLLMGSGSTQATLLDPAVLQAPIKSPEKADPPAAAPATPAGNPSPGPGAPAGKTPKVETLVDAYNAVRQGVITDPAMVLDIAQRFEQLANDPVASKTIEFDAARAATTLRQRAQKLM